MCGRFTPMYAWAELVAIYRLTVGAPPSNRQLHYAGGSSAQSLTPRREQGTAEQKPIDLGRLGIQR
jgi:hypothetical protein